MKDHGYIRTKNPIESTFATVRHQIKKLNHRFSRTTIISCVFNLLMEAEKRWHVLNVKKIVCRVINLEKFIDGIHENKILTTKKLIHRELLNHFSEAIHRSQGMVLVTGPTGSGKTVTLYTAINILNTSETNM